jgi:hypothetical protein
LRRSDAATGLTEFRPLLPAVWTGRHLPKLWRSCAAVRRHGLRNLTWCCAGTLDLTGLFWTKRYERMSLEMPKKRFSAEQIVVVLRQIEVF